MKKPLAYGLRGVLATPIIDDAARVDEASLRREISPLLEHGAVGLTGLGVFGEAARLSPAERIQVIWIVCDEATGFPLVIGLADRETQPALESAAELHDATSGAEAALMVQVRSP